MVSMEYKIGVLLGMIAGLILLKLLEPPKKERGGYRRDDAGHDAYEHVVKPLEAEPHGGFVERDAALPRETCDGGRADGAALVVDGGALGPSKVDNLGGEKRVDSLELPWERGADEAAEK